MMTDQWAYWRAKLAGENPPAYVDNAQSGFYRAYSKSSYGARKTVEPVAIWQADGEFKGHRGSLDNDNGELSETQCHDLWQRICDNPVPEEWYRAVAERGEPWPDEHELVPMGSNQPPPDDSYEGLRDAIEPVAQEAKRLLDAKQVPATQPECDQVANLADRLAELWKQADEARKREKKPHDERVAAVQRLWKPLLDAAEIFKRLKADLITPFLTAQRMKAVKARGEVSQEEKWQAGTRGRAMSLKSFITAEIFDFDLVYEHYKKRPEVQLCLQELANKDIRTREVPGARRREEQRAV